MPKSDHDLGDLILTMRKVNDVTTSAVAGAAAQIADPRRQAMIALSVANICLGMAAGYLARTPTGAPPDMHALLKRTSLEGPGFLLGELGGHWTN